MKRDRNKVCEFCIYFESGKCHFNPPGVVSSSEVSIALPEMQVSQENIRTATIYPNGPLTFKLHEGQTWPFVGCDDFCSHFSDGK